MVWFRVDDKLHSHRKAARAGVEALGLWALAGSWCSDQLTDGFIPDYMARKLDTKANRHAAALVTAGLWEPAEQGGDKGWQFHEWDEYQQTRDETESKRDKWRDKKREQRRDSAGQYEVSTGDAPGDTSETPRESPPGSPTVRDARALSLPLSTSKTSTPSTGVEDTFADFWAVYPKKVGKLAAVKAYSKALMTGVPPERLVEAVESYVGSIENPKFTKDPATWLNAGCWDDEPDSARRAARHDPSKNGTAWWGS